MELIIAGLWKRGLEKPQPLKLEHSSALAGQLNI